MATVLGGLYFRKSKAWTYQNLKVTIAVFGEASIRVYVFAVGLFCVGTTVATKRSNSVTHGTWPQVCATYRNRIDTQVTSTTRSKFTHRVACSIVIGEMDERCDSETSTAVANMCVMFFVFDEISTCVQGLI